MGIAPGKTGPGSTLELELVSATLRESALLLDGSVPGFKDCIAERACERGGHVDEADFVGVVQTDTTDVGGWRAHHWVGLELSMCASARMVMARGDEEEYVVLLFLLLVV